MKKLKLFYVCCFVLLTHGLIYADDFTVTIEQTDDHAHLITPIKAGGSHQLQINVTNNRSDTCTVSIDKSMMIGIFSWVSIDDNSQEIFPSQSKNFLLTITVPANAEDIDYFMPLYFDAYDKANVNHSFDYYTQTIIVDNSPPDAPTFTVSQTSTTIKVNSWDSWDIRSNTYTLGYYATGDGGIKSYKIDIKNPDGSIEQTIPKDFDDNKSHTFINLDPNTNYKACVTAYDLVGNTNTTEKTATTAPEKPTGLVFSNIGYMGVILSWSTSAGATGYDVYQVTGSTNIKLNSSPVAGNSYTILDLNPNTTYEFNIIALSNVGPSDRSNNVSVTTLAFPSIYGSSTICSTRTYTVQNLISGYTVSWAQSENLTRVSAQGSNPCTFQENGLYQGWIEATISGSYGDTLLPRKDIWVGPPAARIMGLTEVAPYSSTTYTALPYYTCQLSSYLWTISSSDYAFAYFSNTMQSYEIETKGELGMFYLYLTTTNACGSQNLLKSITVTSGGGGGLPRAVEVPAIIIYPNPATDYINVKVSDGIIAEIDENKNLKYEIILYNSSQQIVYKKKSDDSLLTIDTKHFDKGFYYLHFMYKDEIIKEQVIISK